MMVVCVLGFDCGFMFGFDNEGVDKEFFLGGKIKLNFFCFIGYGDLVGVFEWLFWLLFDEVC